MVKSSSIYSNIYITITLFKIKELPECKHVHFLTKLLIVKRIFQFVPLGEVYGNRMNHALPAKIISINLHGPSFDINNPAHLHNHKAQFSNKNNSSTPNKNLMHGTIPV